MKTGTDTVKIGTGTEIICPRFTGVIVENGDTLVNWLAYIDLNPVRANIVEKPEDYRWNTLGYLLQTNNKDRFLSLEPGLHNENTEFF